MNWLVFSSNDTEALCYITTGNFLLSPAYEVTCRSFI